MKAAVYHGVGDVRIEDLTDPEPGPGEVKIKVAHNGVCGTDLHEYFSAATIIPLEQHPQTGVAAPVVLGHEFAGTVAETGTDVTMLSAGQRVAVRPTYQCGKCPPCVEGLQNACRVLAFHGLSGPGGGLSEFTVVRADMLHLLPDEVSLELGALVEPMAVAYHAVDRAELGPSDTAVIVGAGPIGVGLWFALRARGIQNVVVSERSEVRRSAISRLGATNVIDPRATDLTQTVMDLSELRGAAAVFDAAGVGAAITESVPCLATHGKIVVVGLHEESFSFNPTGLVLKEAEILGSLVYDDHDYRAVIADMAAGRYDTSAWVEHVPLAGLHDAFDALRAGRKIKILVDL